MILFVSEVVKLHNIIWIFNTAISTGLVFLFPYERSELFFGRDSIFDIPLLVFEIMLATTDKSTRIVRVFICHSLQYNAWFWRPINRCTTPL